MKREGENMREKGRVKTEYVIKIERTKTLKKTIRQMNSTIYTLNKGMHAGKRQTETKKIEVKRSYRKKLMVISITQANKRTN